jgi:CheY-like chemotaxis protein
MKQKSVLLVEDNLNDVELILHSLNEFRNTINIYVVNDGVEALEFLRSEGKFSGQQKDRPSVILLDIKMPRMDGLEVLKEIRSDKNLFMIPVVMLTSSREEQDLYNSYSLGVNAYVVKPVDFNQFNDAIKQIGTFWTRLNEQPSGFN